MNKSTTDTPRTDAAAFGSMTDSWELEQLSRQLERELAVSLKNQVKTQAEVERLRSTMRSFILVSPIEFDRLEKIEAEVERLKEMVMEAARKGDELLEPYRLRAEKAETLLNQIHAFVETLNPNKK